jgi:hypothetical protein
MEMTVKIVFALTLLPIAFSSATLAQSLDDEQLFDGEERIDAAGQPAISYFLEGDKDAPLIVFIPGAAHSARIAYGGHEGANREDFLAHWLQNRGFNFLGVSYPIDTESGLFNENHPEFTVREWGQQAMEIAKNEIEDNDLTGKVIVIGWSMAGKIPQSAYEAAQDLGVPFDFYLSFVATPAIPGMTSLTRTFDKADSGYGDRSSSPDSWVKQLAANNDLNGHEIIPENIYRSQYVGNMSVNLEGVEQRYRDGEFVKDWWEGLEDNGAFEFGDFPLVAMLLNDGRADARHVIVDKAAWSFYNANTVYHRYVTNNNLDLNALSDAQWQSVIDLTRTAPDRLSREVSGNHFFFVGEDGARAAAGAIDNLVDRVHAWRGDMESAIGIDIEPVKQAEAEE